MKTRFYILSLFTILSCYVSFSQNNDEKQWQIVPYLGLSTTQSDFKDLSENGFVLGLSLDKYLSSKFALGLDINYQANDFKNSIDYSSIPSTFGVLSNDVNKWSTATISLGPTYKIGGEKFNLELFLKGGLSMVKVPAQSTTFSGGGVQYLNILELKEESKSSFGITSGVRLNYAISNSLSFFVNPQYVLSASEIGFFHKDITTEGVANPDLLVQDGGQLCYVKPSYLNVNAGLKFNLGGKPNKIEEENVNRNIPFCDIAFDSVSCQGSGQTITLISTWFGHNSNNTIDIKIYNGTSLISSGSLITNNNQPLSSTSGSLSHSLSVSGYSGSVLNAVITIEDQYGVLTCSSPVEFEVPPCPPQPCEFEVDTSNIICNTNSVSVNVTTTYSNIPAGSYLDFELIDLNSPNPITTYAIAPSSIPLGINGTGVKNHTIDITGYNGGNIVIKLNIRDANGIIVCSKGMDLMLPQCNKPNCELALDYTDCANGVSIASFIASWVNMALSSNYTIDVKLFDDQGSLIPGLPTPNPLPVTPANGSQNYNVNLSQYAGTTVTVKMNICRTLASGVLECCSKTLTLDIPKCCEDCTDVILKDNTILNQSNLTDFALEGMITSIPAAERVVAQLEQIGFNTRGNTSSVASNLEFRRGWFMNTSGNYNSSFIGSLYGDRSNILLTDISNPSTTNLIFKLFVDNYTNKKVKKYRVKLTIFKTDGTYCEKYLEN